MNQTDRKTGSRLPIRFVEVAFQLKKKRRTKGGKRKRDREKERDSDKDNL